MGCGAVKPNAQEPWLLLRLAAGQDNEGDAQRILAGKPKPRSDRLCGQTAVHVAALAGSANVLALLLDKFAGKADQAVEDESKDSPLHFAAQSSQPGAARVAQMLLSHRAQVDSMAAGDRTPLHVAARFGCKDTVASLLASRARPDLQSKQGDAPLHEAARGGDAEVVAQLLLAHPAARDAANAEGRTPLHVAAACGHEGAVRRLLEAQASPGARDRNQNTALHLAAHMGRDQATDVLVRMDPALMSAANVHGQTPLHLAASEGGFMAVAHLLHVKASLESADAAGDTALHLAARGGHAEVIAAAGRTRQLMQTQNKAGRTPVHEAAAGGHTTALLRLLERNFLVNQPDGQGLCPLHLAVENLEDGHQAVDELLQGQANPDAVGGSAGSGALAVAARQQKVLTVSSLLLAGAKVAQADQEGSAPLHHAAATGNLDVVELLLERSASVNQQNLQGDSPYTIASTRGYTHLVRVMNDAWKSPSLTDSGPVIQASRSLLPEAARTIRLPTQETPGSKSGSTGLKKLVHTSSLRSVSPAGGPSFSPAADRDALQSLMQQPGPQPQAATPLASAGAVHQPLVAQPPGGGVRTMPAVPQPAPVPQYGSGPAGGALASTWPTPAPGAQYGTTPQHGAPSPAQAQYGAAQAQYGAAHHGQHVVGPAGAAAAPMAATWSSAPQPSAAQPPLYGPAGAAASMPAQYGGGTSPSAAQPPLYGSAGTAASMPAQYGGGTPGLGAQFPGQAAGQFPGQAAGHAVQARPSAPAASYASGPSTGPAGGTLQPLGGPCGSRSAATGGDDDLDRLHAELSAPAGARQPPPGRMPGGMSPSSPTRQSQSPSTGRALSVVREAEEERGSVGSPHLSAATPSSLGAGTGGKSLRPLQPSPLSAQTQAVGRKPNQRPLSPAPAQRSSSSLSGSRLGTGGRVGGVGATSTPGPAGTPPLGTGGRVGGVGASARQPTGGRVGGVGATPTPASAGQPTRPQDSAVRPAAQATSQTLARPSARPTPGTRLGGLRGPP
ncbi:unnamed protein product [Prorocentrum cordatum]|uniref:Uncharacterized protein n=1 Tax=Prorocentrum cordatum TaxID=2364126 RepID=A0ABN9S924_9DINO|nr:unnamed protein product [Polarella glacialis]